MKDRQDWDVPEIEGDFALIEEIDILDTSDFELGELETPVESIENEPEEKPDFTSIINDEPLVAEGNVIEPSTMIEEQIIQETQEGIEEASAEAVSSEEGKEHSFSEEQKGSQTDKELLAAQPAADMESEAVTEKAEEFVLGTNAAEGSEKLYEEEAKMEGRFKQEDINSALKNFLDISPDFLAAAIVSSDGFVIASVLPENVEENKLGAMSAAILSLGERAAQELDKGNLETVFVEGENGYVLLSSVNPEMLLVVSTTKYAKLGLVFYELSALKKTIKSLFE